MYASGAEVIFTHIICVCLSLELARDKRQCSRKSRVFIERISIASRDKKTECSSRGFQLYREIEIKRQRVFIEDFIESSRDKKAECPRDCLEIKR